MSGLVRLLSLIPGLVFGIVLCSVLAAAQQVALAFLAALALERLDHPLADAQRGIRHRTVQIESDHPAEATAFRASAQGIVEGEQCGRGRTQRIAGVRVRPSRGEEPRLILRGGLALGLRRVGKRDETFAQGEGMPSEESVSVSVNSPFCQVKV